MMEDSKSAPPFFLPLLSVASSRLSSSPLPSGDFYFSKESYRAKKNNGAVPATIALWIATKSLVENLESRRSLSLSP